MSDDTRKKREALKGKLLGEFNKVAPKVMKVEDLAKNFEKDDSRYFKSIWDKVPELFAEHMVNNLVKKDIPPQDGVYVGVENGKTVQYISSDFLKRMLIQQIDAGKVDGHFGPAEKAGLAAIDAIKDSPDQTDKVKSGQIKPKAAPKPGS